MQHRTHARYSDQILKLYTSFATGWAFNASGRCEAIPQGGNPASARACAVSYPCTVRQELLWVKLTPQPIDSATDGSQPAPADTSDIPIIPEVEARTADCSVPKSWSYLVLAG